MVRYKELNLTTRITATDCTHEWDRKKKTLTYQRVPKWYVGRRLMDWGNNVPRVFRPTTTSIEFIKGE